MRDLVKRIGVRVLIGIPQIDSAMPTLLRARLIRRFLDPAIGAECGLDRAKKLELWRKLRAISRHVRCATDLSQWIVLATRILQIPKTVKGAVIECGCYKGASTCALSLICSAAGRRLTVCDSFCGLPDDEPTARHRYPHLGVKTTYTPGLFAGRLDEVKDTLSQWGDSSVCDFIPGFFSESLIALHEPIVFGFLDVDLALSMRDCLRHIWPLLVEGGFIYTDDSCDMDVVKIWFEPAFWQALGFDPPGYIGSGSGICGLSADYTSLGYSTKLADNGLHPATFW